MGDLLKSETVLTILFQKALKKLSEGDIKIKNRRSARAFGPHSADYPTSPLKNERSKTQPSAPLRPRTSQGKAPPASATALRYPQGTGRLRFQTPTAIAIAIPAPKSGSGLNRPGCRPDPKKLVKSCHVCPKGRRQDSPRLKSRALNPPPSFSERPARRPCRIKLQSAVVYVRSHNFFL